MYKYLISAVCLAGSVTCAAHEAEDTPITVLAAGTRTALSKTGRAVTVFDRSEMDRVQGADLARLVERAPGVTVSRNGGIGGYTALHVRGAEGEQLLVLVDGVPLADPAAPGGGFDLGNLLMGTLAQVELQRGSNSTIWGNQALGGVLAVTTDREDRLAVAVERGAWETGYLTAGGQVAMGPASIGLQAAHFRSGGFSAAAGGSEPDGFRQTELAGRGELRLGGGWSAFAHVRRARGRLEIDGFPAPEFVLSDTAEFQETRQLSGAAGLRYSGPAVDLQGVWSAAATKRLTFDPPGGATPTFTADGHSERIELRGRWRLLEGLAVDFGGEHERLRYATLHDPQRQTAMAGTYAQLDHTRGPLHLAIGLRLDEHRDFGEAWSFGADMAYQLSRLWRLRASYGDGFKAPTLFQLHSDYGNAALRPETSRSYDAGLSYDGTVQAGLSVFARETRELIAFVSCWDGASVCEGRPFGTYDNVGRAMARGVEFEGGGALSDTVRLGAAYTYLEAIDQTPGSPNQEKDLPRRPRHALALSGDWRPAPPVLLGADIRMVSGSSDDSANAIALDGYAVVTLRAEWNATAALTLHGRVENAADEEYQTAFGYATAGRSAYLGARARF